MHQSEIDRQQQMADKFSVTVEKLGHTISAQGIGVSEKLDHASFRIQKSVDDATDRLSKSLDKASEASERHAGSLVRATWALVFATIALVVVTAIYVYVAATTGAG